MIKLKHLIERLNTKTMTQNTYSYMNEMPAYLNMEDSERNEYLNRISIDTAKKNLKSIEDWYSKYIRQINFYRDEKIQNAINDLKIKIKQNNSIHDDGENSEREGHGYGSPSHPIYGRKAPDRPYRSDRGSFGSEWVGLTPEV